MRFRSEVQLGEHLHVQPIETVKNEPMLFNARGDWAYVNGGPITRDFLEAFLIDNPELSLEDVVFDSRVHMLMPGWFPCIPGFHHDDVPRLRKDGQPWYAENEIARAWSSMYVIDPRGLYRSKHAMGMVGDDICRTQFALGEAKFTPVSEGNVLYRQWHPEVERHLSFGHLEDWSAPMHQLVYFDDRTWHQGVEATGSGWRWFGRASWDTDRVKNVTNEIRRQVQVYMANPMEGW